MNAREAIKQSMNMPDMIWKSYLNDLSDEDLLVRPVDGANHLAWQFIDCLMAEPHPLACVSEMLTDTGCGFES